MYKQIGELDIVLSSHQGKVRDIYDLGDKLLIVTSDRISAFDVVFPDPLPGKGVILNQIAAHIFKTTSHIVPNHFITDRVEEYPEQLQAFKDYLEGRSMLVKKLRVIPVECIVRGYISGSAWSEYQKTRSIGGLPIEEDLQESQAFAQPIFTPSTKASEGHDLNISYNQMRERMDTNIAEFIRDRSLELYSWAHAQLREKGILLADTKFEFGALGNEILLADEALTPDSSRFWDLSQYQVGQSPASFDKQIVRDYLSSTSWNKQPPAPHLPDDIVRKALDKYRQIRDMIIGDNT
ncbi:MAG: phosphoribosylaminoimidazolesuccinocarboxamide synthase [Candidatus Cloacimonetes bacterium]|nr:phosphoribosylaminoimidazolesuccinocarboxamide synthase [Candidatus Cloacimonadota bacterium]